MKKFQLYAKLSKIEKGINEIKYNINRFKLDIEEYVHDELSNPDIKTDSSEFNKLFELTSKKEYIDEFVKSIDKILIALNSIDEQRLV